MARSTWPTHPRVVEARRRWPVVNAGVHAIERYTLHRTGRTSALISHYAFLSMFPLMLVFTTVVGFVLDGNPTLRDNIIDSAISRIPIIGPELVQNPDSLSGSVPVLVIGLLTALYGGLKAFNVVQMALDDIADVALEERPNIVGVRLRSLLGIAIVGTGWVGGAILAGLLGVSGVAWLHRAALLAGSITVNTCMLAASYRYLCTRRPSWRRVAPGAVIGGVLFAALQVVGTTVATRAIARALPIYGTFATVIGLITWLGLHTMTMLLCAELNGVLPIERLEVPELVNSVE
jgi:uncharacterized BrkB/YihY/UPF0761 family membrane protein